MKKIKESTKIPNSMIDCLKLKCCTYICDLRIRENSYLGANIYVCHISILGSIPLRTIAKKLK